MCDGIQCHGVVDVVTVRSGMTNRSRHFVAIVAGSMCHAVDYKKKWSPVPVASGCVVYVALKKAISFLFHTSLR